MTKSLRKYILVDSFPAVRSGKMNTNPTKRKMNSVYDYSCIMYDSLSRLLFYRKNRDFFIDALSVLCIQVQFWHRVTCIRCQIRRHRLVCTAFKPLFLFDLVNLYLSFRIGALFWPRERQNSYKVITAAVTLSLPCSQTDDHLHLNKICFKHLT